MAKKKRRAWTGADLKSLKSMARKKTPAGRIAKTLKRTEGATRQKAFSMGMSLGLLRCPATLIAEFHESLYDVSLRNTESVQCQNKRCATRRNAW
jgi:hypothetical protein